MRSILGLSVACLLGGCVASSTPGPVVGTASLTPSVANPGQPVTISYELDDRGGAIDIVAISIVGLPAGAAAQLPPLPLPKAAGAMQSVDIVLPVPTRAGSYPLALRVAVAHGRPGSVPVGTLVVNQMPARLSDATLDPALHSAGACSGATLSARLAYTIESANGAASVSEIRLLPTELASALPVLPNTPLVLKDPVVAAPPPAQVTTSLRSFPVRPLVAVAPVPRQVAAVGPVPSASDGANLVPSQRWDLARDRVTTSVEIPCNLPAPTVWHFPIVGIVNGALPTNTVAADYRVDP